MDANLISQSNHTINNNNIIPNMQELDELNKI